MNLYLVQWKPFDDTEKRKAEVHNVVAASYGNCELECKNHKMSEYWYVHSIELIEKDILIEE